MTLPLEILCLRERSDPGKPVVALWASFPYTDSVAGTLHWASAVAQPAVERSTAVIASFAEVSIVALAEPGHNVLAVEYVVDQLVDTYLVGVAVDSVLVRAHFVAVPFALLVEDTGEIADRASSVRHSIALVVVH